MSDFRTPLSCGKDDGLLFSAFTLSEYVMIFVISLIVCTIIQTIEARHPSYPGSKPKCLCSIPSMLMILWTALFLSLQRYYSVRLPNQLSWPEEVEMSYPDCPTDSSLGSDCSQADPSLVSQNLPGTA
jgi:hypothetical protein